MHRPASNNIATPGEALAIVAICFGWFIFSALQSAASAGHNTAFSDETLLQIIAVEIVSGGLALAVLKRRNWSLAKLLPTPTALGCGIGVLLYIATIPASWLAMAPFYEPHLVQPLRDLMPQQRPSPLIVVSLAMVNGMYEEVFLLGYLLRGLRQHGLIFALGASLLVRLLYHVYQGPLGAASVLAFGLIVSLYYVRTWALWPAAFAHVVADTVALL